MRKRAGRKRKTNAAGDPTNISAAADRYPNGQTKHERPPGPHEVHMAKRAALGYDRGEHFEEALAIYWIPALTRQQIDAGLRYGHDWSFWLASIGVKSIQAQIYERCSGGYIANEETERDRRAKDSYDIAQMVLRDAGTIPRRAVRTLITQNVIPPDVEEAICGLNALVAYYEKGIRKAA